MNINNTVDSLTWDLSVLYTGFDDPRFLSDVKSIAPLATDSIQFLKNAENALPQTKADTVTLFTEIVMRLQRLTAVCADTSSFVNLTMAADADNKIAESFQSELNAHDPLIGLLDSLMCRIAGKVSDAGILDEVLSATPLLMEHRFFFTEAANRAKHLIPPALEETVLQLQVSGSTAWSQLRDMLDGTATVDITLNGKQETLPLPQVRNMAYSADPVTRKTAYMAEIASYKKNEIPLSFALNCIKAESNVVSKLKGYDSLLDETLDNSRMKKTTLTAMIAAMEESLPVFRRYFKAKAKYLGHSNGLPFYDLFAPLRATSATSEKTYTVDQARKYLVDIMKSFSPKMSSFIDTAFTQRWIDLLPRKGKGGGAFCHGLHTQRQSRVLTNFTGTFSDITTIAHELGHAYHDSCLNDASILNCDYPMPLAETASIFNETLVTKAALAATSSQDQLTLLETEISDAAQVIVDILSRYYFETQVVETSQSRRMTVTELQVAMKDAQLRTYGDGLDPDYLHNDLWVCKCHYYIPECHFYNFPYAFGLLFSKGLYALYQKDASSFVKKYDDLLAATGTASIEDVAMLAGIDVSDISFWRSSLAVIAEDIALFERLTE